MTESSGRLPAGDSELWELVEALVEGTATPQEQERLEARLRAGPQAQAFYVAYLDLHSFLQWRTRGESAGRSKVSPFWPTARGSWTRMALAASLLIGLGLLAGLLATRHGPDEDGPPDFPDAPPGSVAVLIDNSNTVWEKDMTLPTETGSALPPGRLKLKAGVVELAFRGGGEVTLEGPADLDVRASDQAFLHRGKLVAQVPKGTPGFQISTPGMVVTDFGGECGLLSDGSGQTEVHVFEGQVGASPTDKSGEPLPGMRLGNKAGARIDVAHRAIVPVPLNEQAFSSLRPEVRVVDAPVRAGQFSGRNFAAAPHLVVKNSIADYTWDSYLRFDLSGIKGPVSQAVVRLVPVHVGHPMEIAAAMVPDNLWGETTLTWNNKPPSGPPFARWLAEEGKATEIDVTRLVQVALAGDKKLSLRLFAPERKRGSAFVQYGSRRGEAETRPQLLLTIAP
jgi:hypothetical protein